jgi:hypothetical protein
MRYTAACSTVLILCLFSLAAAAQQASDKPKPPPNAPSVAKQLPVNWLYGAYVPTEAPLVSLTNQQRWKLYVRQSFTTPGIYIKTGLFAVQGTVRNSPPAWGQSADGFAKRLGTRYAQFMMQNSFTASGDALAKWEPRYDRCRRCSGFKDRARHAFVRNYITYAGDEKSLRPQIFLYASAFGAASISSLWQPNNPNTVVKGYQGAITQAWVGVVSNLIGEFAPDVRRAIRHRHDK